MSDAAYGAPVHHRISRPVDVLQPREKFQWRERELLNVLSTFQPIQTTTSRAKSFFISETCSDGGEFTVIMGETAASGFTNVSLCPFLKYVRTHDLMTYSMTVRQIRVAPKYYST